MRAVRKRHFQRTHRVSGALAAGESYGGQCSTTATDRRFLEFATVSKSKVVPGSMKGLEQGQLFGHDEANSP